MADSSSLTVRSLASGSSGNSFVVCAGSTAVLIDAGLPAGLIFRHLRDQGLDRSALAAVFLTHEHGDHVQSAGALSRKLGIPVVANAPTLEAAETQAGSFQGRILPVGDRIGIGDLEVQSFAVCHDAAAPVGYLIRHRRGNIFIATDLGCAQEHLLGPLSEADLIILEANHDRTRLVRGPYPAALKERILGEQGHLSNEEAAGLLCSLQTGRRCVWLAHISAVNNGPYIAHRAVCRRLAEASTGDWKVSVLNREHPSPIWSPDDVAWQLGLE